VEGLIVFGGRTGSRGVVVKFVVHIGKDMQSGMLQLA
jgi:hypothetical protein